jgi:hypothetical protein
LTSPLQLITGQTWVFQTQSSANPMGEASIGKFTATYVPPTTKLPSGKGTLNITETISLPSTVVRELAVPGGSYEINPDCSGGTLFFSTAEQPAQFTFIFARNFTQMYLMSSVVSADIPINIWGKATLLFSPIVCPANPLNVFNGTTFGFGLSPASYYGSNPPAGVGIFTAGPGTDRGSTVGLVSGTLSLAPFDGSPTIQASFPEGRYTVDPDCSGGTISFLTSVLPQGFQYIFVNSDFTEMYMLSLDETDPLGGDAKRFR